MFRTDPLDKGFRVLIQYVSDFFVLAELFLTNDYFCWNVEIAFLEADSSCRRESD